MSHSLFWRGVTFFYPIGNTSAVHLTESLPPDQHADILLLACGDPRHILYTVFANGTTSRMEPQKLDITCCDIEPAVLARNVLLFTFLADEGAEGRLDNVWNIFYHLMVDKSSLSLLVAQCRKLVPMATDLKTWKESPYSHFLFMCSEETLSSMRQLWNLWIDVADLKSGRAEQFKKEFLDGMKKVVQKHSGGSIVTSCRSAGPLAPLTFRAVPDQFNSFWSSGITDDGTQKGEKATNANPTLAFSLAGETFAVHYGTDPMAGFHLAEVFASNVSTLSAQRDTILVQKMVRAARDQFSQWCTAVIKLLKHGKAASCPLVIRMFAGDALMFCQALQYARRTGNASTPINIAQWTCATIEFDEDLYGENTRTLAPTSFHIIDTSNVLDHLGLLNLLTATVPLLRRSLSSTLYTEALLRGGDVPTQGIRQYLCGELLTISLLMGVMPSTLLSQFTTRSNLSESIMGLMDTDNFKQYHERLAWKVIDSSVAGFAGPEATVSLSFSPSQLSDILHGVYREMFCDENVARKFNMLTTSPGRVIQESNLCHYTRRSFAQFVHLIKSRIQTDWKQTMDDFDDKVTQDTSLILSSNFYQEMCCHFHLLGVTSFESMSTPFLQNLRTKKQPQIFQSWSAVPAIVSVVLVVPRAAIRAIEVELKEAGTPALLGNIMNSRFHNVFADISAVWGSLQVVGLGEHRKATVVEDRAGKSGSSPLLISFSAPSFSLMISAKLNVGLSIRSTPATTAIFLRKLGVYHTVFEAQLEDTKNVYVLAERPKLSNSLAAGLHMGSFAQPAPALAPGRSVSVQMDASCNNIQSFTIRVDITDPAAKTSLAGGSAVAIEQVSTHQARLRIGKFEQILGFPLPVDVSNAKLRIARKSMYVEVIAPMSLSTNVKGERDITKKFLAFFEGGRPTLWNVHRVNLDRCPPFKFSNKANAFNWLVPHVSLMFSNRERVARSKTSPVVKDTLMNLKDTLHTLLLSVAGVEGRPPQSVFALYNTSTSEAYAYIFVAGLRLDIGSHTLLADTWVAPATSAVQNKFKSVGAFQVISIKTDADESAAWRHVLPLLTERCRAWAHKPSCEYLVQNSIPLFPDVGSDPEKSPFCSCGAGVGADALPKRFRVLSPYVTRAAFSPFFAVSYLEKVGMTEEQSEGACKTCGKESKTLLVCSKCKNAKYCSRDCQVKDWKTHKPKCV